MSPEAKKQLHLVTTQIVREFLEESRAEILRRVAAKIKELKAQTPSK